jgi:hypothetical protein
MTCQHFLPSISNFLVTSYLSIDSRIQTSRRSSRPLTLEATWDLCCKNSYCIHLSRRSLVFRCQSSFYRRCVFIHVPAGTWTMRLRKYNLLSHNEFLFIISCVCWRGLRVFTKNLVGLLGTWYRIIPTPLPTQDNTDRRNTPIHPSIHPSNQPSIHPSIYPFIEWSSNPLFLRFSSSWE